MRDDHTTESSDHSLNWSWEDAELTKTEIQSVDSVEKSGSSLDLALSNTCMFLALAFRYPEQEVFSEISRHLSAFEPLFADYALQLPHLPPRPELEEEYVALFVNNNGHVPAPPYAACYLDQEGLLMGPTYDLVTECLVQTGYELRDRVRDLEDHVALLLEFCSGLLSRLASTDGTSRTGWELRALCTVVLKVLKPMSGPLHHAVVKNACLAFYPAMTKCLYAFMEDMEQMCISRDQGKQ